MSDNVFSIAQAESKHKEAEKQNLLDTVEEVRKKIEDGEILNGDIVGLTKTDAVINIGFKIR